MSDIDASASKEVASNQKKYSLATPVTWRRSECAVNSVLIMFPQEITVLEHIYLIRDCEEMRVAHYGEGTAQSNSHQTSLRPLGQGD